MQPKLKKPIKIFAFIILSIYILGCTTAFFIQEKLIFNPKKLSQNYAYNFEIPFEEINVKSPDGVSLNSVLFKTQTQDSKKKGLIFYLHGNGSNVADYENTAKIFTDLGYDVFMPEYRGFGKSDGKIKNENNLFSDAQVFYDKMKEIYPENKIILIGFSLGTGFATKLCTQNSPKMLILQAPYYNIKQVMQERAPFLPTFLLKYQVDTSKNIVKCKSPILIFHGDEDKNIPPTSSYKLEKLLKPEDRLIILKGQTHYNVSRNQQFLEEFNKIQ